METVKACVAFIRLCVYNIISKKELPLSMGGSVLHFRERDAFDLRRLGLFLLQVYADSYNCHNYQTETKKLRKSNHEHHSLLQESDRAAKRQFHGYFIGAFQLFQA